MRTLFIIPLVLMSLVSFPSWGLTMDDLVKRGVFYKKFTDVPFTGEVEGIQQGKFRDGKRDGFWVGYHQNGQLNFKGKFIDGSKQGPWEFYHDNGSIKSKGEFKDGKREGYWYQQGPYGLMDNKLTGTYKNGVKVSD